MDEALRKKIEDLVQKNEMILFMKGNKLMPQCGFSAKLVQVLLELNVEFETCDVLQNPDIRLHMEEYSDWPTFPQLFFRGKLVGGCDIVVGMYESGELKKLFEKD
jgi:monothiol glutaredoxin